MLLALLLIDNWNQYNCLVAAPKFVEKLQDLEITAGKKAVIDCVVEGEPEPDIKWTFEGQPLKESDR